LFLTLLGILEPVSMRSHYMLETFPADELLRRSSLICPQALTKFKLSIYLVYQVYACSSLISYATLFVIS